jgi:hypothetical protein
MANRGLVMIRTLRLSLVVLLLPALVSGCISLDIEDYVDGGAGAQAAPFDASRRDCRHASETAAPADAVAAARAYDICMAARGWPRS